MRDAGLEKYVITDDAVSDQQKIAYFLFAAFGPDAKDIIDQCMEDDLSKKRMMNILQKDSDVSGRWEEIELWSDVQKKIIRYETLAGAVTIFFDKHMPVALRVQASKNCYQHAVCGTLGYKIAHGKGDNEFAVHTVDTAKAVRHHYTLEQLRKRVKSNKGGSSYRFLTTLTKSTTSGGNLFSIPSSMLVHQNFSSLFQKEGPALISRFSTDDFFRNKDNRRRDPPNDGKLYIHQFDRANGEDVCDFVCLDQWTDGDEEFLQKLKDENNQTEYHNVVPAVSTSFSGSPGKHGGDVDESQPTDEDDGIADADGEDDDNEDDDEGAGGLHAIIAMGCRSVQGDGQQEKTFILIQNTHRHLPIFEASIAYLEHHLQQREGKLTFMVGNLTAKSSLPLIHNKGLCLESSSADDIPEAFDEEGEEEAEDPYDSDDLEGN